MIIDSLWRLVPYVLFSAAVWVLAVNIFLIIGSLPVETSIWFWVRLVVSVLVCVACGIWIHHRHIEV